MNDGLALTPYIPARLIKSIQRGTIAIDSASGTDFVFDVTISAVDTSKSVIVPAGVAPEASRSAAEYSGHMTFQNATTVRLTRAGTGASGLAGTQGFAVVEFV